MSSPLFLYQSATDEYLNEDFTDRLVAGFTKKDRFSTLTALFAPVSAPRSAIINRCREKVTSDTPDASHRKLFWIEPFRAWDMFSIGNLSLALLWHMYRSLPQGIVADEKIIYKLGKISVTLPALTDGLRKNGSGYSHTADRHTSITTKAFPADRKSSVSSIFSACEQIAELSETFRSIGTQIASSGGFDAMVIPIVDIDQCLPEQAISLLFAIRNFICCDSISFIVAVDNGIMSRFLISLYDNALTLEQSNSTLLSLFDDWAYLPSPSLKKMIQHIDNKLVEKECEYILTKLNDSDILTGFSDFTLLHHGFNRFNSFKNQTLQKYNIEELTVGLLLFLTGALEAATLRCLALKPDLEQVIDATRLKGNSGTAGPSVSASPAANRDITDSRYLPGVLLTVPASITGATIARWIERIVPFI